MSRVRMGIGDPARPRPLKNKTGKKPRTGGIPDARKRREEMEKKRREMEKKRKAQRRKLGAAAAAGKKRRPNSRSMYNATRK